MICIRKRYFNWNRILLLPFGLWPDKETKFTRFQARFFCCLLMSSIAFQFSRLFNAKCSIDRAIRLLSSATLFLMLAIMFICLWVNMKNVKYILDQLQHIYDGLKDRNEIEIYEKYGYFGKRLTTKVIVLTMCGTFCNSIIIYSPYILDIVMPKNESYAIHMMEMVTNYFFVSEKYYFLILVHLNAACTTELIVLGATTTMMMAIFKHVCGMFAIARFAKCFMNEMEGSFFFLIIATVLCLSVNLFRIFQTESLTKEMEVVLHFLAVLGMILGMYLANYTGQEITDHSNYIYIITYNVS
ncbi:uncharacterized protein LOC105283870 isoform X3 [Ooceraea biroi]|uniref:uncharacterized protein LOC105283870 isoform X3 n=1 Tax=Ooceraea biroi TaxID=2015173 RepID=UPI000F09551B|nr:uncharacterized protein LOC105283870 isoform X3 [Ooceraea biroi]